MCVIVRYTLESQETRTCTIANDHAALLLIARSHATLCDITTRFNSRRLHHLCGTILFAVGKTGQRRDITGVKPNPSERASEHKRKPIEIVRIGNVSVPI